MIKNLLIICAVATTVIVLGTPAVQADSLDPAALINKSHPLRPLMYAPPPMVVPPVLIAKQPADPEMLLTPLAADALTQIFQTAQSDGISLVLASGYRSYEDQTALYTTSLRENEAAATESVAPPGYSEHQSGLAADVAVYSHANYFCAAQGCFALSRAAAWLDQNAYRYGFIVRYPLHKEASTGYEYEPWHVRYVGSPLAAQLHRSHETLEEFYGLP